VVTDVEVPVATIGNLSPVPLLKLEPQSGSWSFGAGSEVRSRSTGKLSISPSLL